MLNLIETELALKSDHCLNLPSKEADALQNFANKRDLSERNFLTIQKVLFEALQKSDALTCRRLWRLIPFLVARPLLTNWALISTQSLEAVLPLLGVVL
jgi:hypothetical protein